MGRPKKISSQVEQKATVPKNRNVGADLVSENANLSTNKVEKTCKRVVWDPNIEVHFFEPSPSSRKVPRNRITGRPVRRSRRLQNAALPLNMEVDCLTQEMTVIVSDDEDETVIDIEASLEDKNLEEQVQYLLRVYKKQQEVLNSLKSKTTKGPPSETSSTGEVTYKSLHINSQMKMDVVVEENNLLHKKTEGLVEKNHQLNKKLEQALGKIEGFEKGIHVSSKVLEKLKGVIVCSLTKGSGAGAYILSEVLTRR